MQCIDRTIGDPHNGKEILHHPTEPVSVVFGSFEQLSLLLSGQILLIIQNSGDRTADPGQRCPQIVRHPSQQIRPELFTLTFQAELFLLLDTGHQRGNYHADGQHGHKCQRIAIGGKINLHIRCGEGKVYCDDTGQCCQDSVEISLCQK